MFKIKGKYYVNGVEEKEYGVPGLFAYVKKTPDGVSRSRPWHGCREEFSKDWVNSPNSWIVFGVYSKRQRGAPSVAILENGKIAYERENVVEFLRLTEEKLGLKEFSEVTGFENDDAKILIKPAKWWTISEVRRQFLTAVLRSAVFYKSSFIIPLSSAYNPTFTNTLTDEYEKALYSTHYFALTTQAVEKFFKGYTAFKVDPKIGYNDMLGSEGWLHYFQNGNNLDRLIKPE